ncbi:MAG: Ig-like domain-containing protein [Calditrichia bacterium]
MRDKFIIAAFLLFPILAMAQVTGLSDWNIFVDPGHSQNENMPTFSWAISEAKRNVRVALELRDMLMNETDIDTVYLSRTNDTQSVSLSQRTDLANFLKAAWYHSIHTDAGGESSNSTLLLWGGWIDNGTIVEKTPNGGQAMSQIMVDLLTRGMRTTTRGDYADRTFYEGFPYNHDKHYPYLHVNRESDMASELSEAGFHTNLRQNQLYMNHDWRRMEARTFFWSILAYHNIPRPPADIVAGIITDAESGIPINGAVISVEGRQYVTDTYESLFNQFTSDPDLLHNGFYYLENMDYDSVTISVNAENYVPDSARIAVSSTFFTFKDFALVSSIPPYLASSTPADGDTAVSILDDIVLTFSRPMNVESVESSLTIQPEIPLNFSWRENNSQLRIQSDSLEFLTNYTITIPGSVTDQYDHLFDGDADGNGGDGLSLSFKTGFDVYPPKVIAYYPSRYQKDVERRPIVNIEFDEELADTSITPENVFLEKFDTKETVPGIIKHYVVDKRSVLNFFPTEDLTPGALYVARIYPGLKDLYGNATVTYLSVSFNAATTDLQVTPIDPLEAGFSSYWWQPANSGSTTGINPSPGIYMEESQDYLNELTSSQRSLKLYYDWDLNASGWLIREYLSGGAPRSVFFDTTYTLQCYVFGDGSHNLFRFALDEGDGASWPNHEVSQWYEIDWLGWKLIEWKLSDPSTVQSWAGLGNGKLDMPSYRIDSFQLAYQAGAFPKGFVYFDDLRLVKKIPTSIARTNPEGLIPDRFSLDQNYPNPFNPATTISFSIPKKVHVSIGIYNTLGQLVKTLVSEEKNPGNYRISFDASSLASGIYVYEMRAGDFVQAKKMIFMK